MGAPARGSRYVLVSPVKDEEKYVETTLRAVLNQTVRPLRWVLVNDGSSDIDFPSDYFESLMDKFQQDPRPGIASGVYLESPRGVWLSLRRLRRKEVAA